MIVNPSSSLPCLRRLKLLSFHAFYWGVASDNIFWYFKFHFWIQAIMKTFFLNLLSTSVHDRFSLQLRLFWSAVTVVSSAVMIASTRSHNHFSEHYGSFSQLLRLFQSVVTTLSSHPAFTSGITILAWCLGRSNQPLRLFQLAVTSVLANTTTITV